MKDKIAHVVSCDFDGCLHSSKLNGSVREHNKYLLAAIAKQNDLSFNTCLLFSGSNRQSQAIDQFNALKYRGGGNPYSFPAFKDIAEQGGIKATLCPILLADTYSEKPDGYSFTRAIVKMKDADAYHPGTIFDEFKSTIVYLQTHMAVKLMRGCDFFIYPAVDDLQSLYQLPFLSNAAYVYSEASGKLFYVNRVELIVDELPIQESALIEALLTRKKDQLVYEEHDFETPYHDSVVKGFYVDDALQDELAAITGHRHIVKDYRLIYDYYDDREDILKAIRDIFNKKNTGLLPSNVTLRFCRYEVARPSIIIPTLKPIQGTGQIDLNPKLTLLALAKKLINKDEIVDEDYLVERESTLFSSFLEKEASEDLIFKSRQLAKPSVGHHSDDVKHAQIDWYHSCLAPNHVKELSELILGLHDEIAREGFFRMDGSNLIFSKKRTFVRELTLKEKKQAALIRILNESRVSSLERIYVLIDACSEEITQGNFSTRTRDILTKIRPNIDRTEDEASQSMRPGNRS